MNSKKMNKQNKKQNQKTRKKPRITLLRKVKVRFYILRTVPRQNVAAGKLLIHEEEEKEREVRQELR